LLQYGVIADRERRANKWRNGDFDVYRQALTDRAFSAYALAPEHLGKLRVLNLALKLLGKRRVVARTRFGMMDLDTTDLVQREILLRGVYEPRTIARLQQILGPGDTFLDIGAHVGQYALVAATLVGASGRVVAIEPNPVVCATLLENRARTEPAARFDVVSGALSDVRGLVSFGVASTGNLGSNRMVGTGRSDAVTCQTLTYHNLVDELGIAKVRAAKIDVEGAELKVLRGFGDVERARWPDHILFEFIPDAFDYGDSAQTLLSFFTENNYVLRDVDGVHYAPGNDLPEFNLWAIKVELA